MIIVKILGYKGDAINQIMGSGILAQKLQEYITETINADAAYKKIFIECQDRLNKNCVVLMPRDHVKGKTYFLEFTVLVLDRRKVVLFRRKDEMIIEEMLSSGIRDILQDAFPDAVIFD